MDVDLPSLLEGLGAARRFADPTSPRSVRLMAAGGTLPFPPPVIATILFALTTDSDAEIAERAQTSLRGLPRNVIEAAIVAPLPPALLDFFVTEFTQSDAWLEKIALNPATHDTTFARLARVPNSRLIDICSSNQTRLLRSPELVEALSENPSTSQATIDRVLEFMGLHRSQSEEAAEAPPAGVQAPEPSPGTAPGNAAFQLDDMSEIAEELLEELEPPASDQEAEDRTQNLLALIQKMNVMEKIKLARVGNGEARSLLVRDRNKVVAQAAIRSPKVGDNEIISFAKSRQVCDDVLRIIAFSREWTKSYQVKLALATNPKAPAGQAIKFLNYLTDRDLRAIMRSRDVPAMISTHARRILSKKGKI